jgi:hypothetical protein
MNPLVKILDGFFRSAKPDDHEIFQKQSMPEIVFNVMISF